MTNLIKKIECRSNCANVTAMQIEIIQPKPIINRVTRVISIKPLYHNDELVTFYNSFLILHLLL